MRLWRDVGEALSEALLDEWVADMRRMGWYARRTAAGPLSAFAVPATYGSVKVGTWEAVDEVS